MLLAFQNLEFFTDGTVAAAVQKTFSLDPSRTGFLFGVYTLCYGLMQIPVGLAYARFRPTHLLMLACIVFGVGNLLFAYAPSLTLAALGRFVAGIGGAFFFLGYLAVSAHNFKPLIFARLLGYNQMIKFLVLLAVLVILPAILSFSGWRNYFAFISGAFLISIIPLFFLDRRLPVEKKPDQASSIKEDLLSVIKNPQIIFVAIIGMLGSGGIIAFSGLWYLPYAEDLGYPVKKADWIVFGMMMAMGIGMLASGWISDSLKKRKPVIIIGILGTLIPISIGLIWTTHPDWLEAPLMFVAAFASSLYYAIIYVVAKESVSARLATTVGGVLNTSVFIGAAMMQYLPGLVLHLLQGGGAKIADATKTEFQWALVVFPIGLIFCLIVAFRLKETHCIQPA